MRRTATAIELRRFGRSKTTSARCCVARFKWRKCHQRELNGRSASVRACTSLRVPRRCSYRSSSLVRCQHRHQPRARRATSSRRSRHRPQLKRFKRSEYRRAAASSQTTAATERSTARQPFHLTRHRSTRSRLGRWTRDSAKPTATARCPCPRPSRPFRLIYLRVHHRGDVS